MARPGRGRAMRTLAVAMAVVAGPFGIRDAAAESAPPPKPWYEEVQVNGFLSTSYGYNFGSPDSRVNAFRVFDVDDNTFKVDVLELVVQHAPAGPGSGGFRADVTAGGSIPHVTAAAGLFRDASGAAQDIDLQQAYASYLVPGRWGVRLDAGKFVTHFGTEVIEGYDGWNDDATRSLLFGFAIPFTHTGVRASASFSSVVGATLMLVNGWDNATDNNRSKSVGAQLALTPNPRTSLFVNGMIGAERADSERDLRRLIDFVASVKATSRVTLGANADLGSEDGLAAGGGSAEWSGVAGYVRVQATERFALCARLETFDDADGVRTGVDQTLSEFTLTPEFKVTPRFILRGDLRHDHSDQDVFLDGADPTDSQTTVLVNALVTF